MDGLETPSKIDLRFAEHKVLFLICDCSLDKKYSFYNIGRQDAEEMIYRLRHLEKMTWKQLAALGRKDGLTVEKPDSESFSMIDAQNTSASKFMEKYYFHFRVEKIDKFRIFGYQNQQYFCITHIDPSGKIHHT